MSLLICFTCEVEDINQDSKNAIVVIGQPQPNVAQESTTKAQNLGGKSSLSKSKTNSPHKFTCTTIGLNVKSKGAGELLNKVLSNKLIHDHAKNSKIFVTTSK